MHTLKLALNKSMHASDHEQGINKLQPKATILARAKVVAKHLTRLKILKVKQLRGLNLSCFFS